MDTLKPHLDTKNSNLDKLGQSKMSRFFVNKNNRLRHKKGDLDTISEEHIGGY